MKNRKIFFSFISVLLLFAVMSFTAACNRKKDPKERETDKNAVIIADFDTWESGFQLMRFVNQFGNAEMNRDPDFVRDGVGSAKLQPLGSYAAGSLPLMFLPFKSDLFGFDYTDLSKGEKITVDFYNAGSETVNVTMGLVGSVIGTDIERASVYTRKLKSGWNEIQYYFDLNIVNIAYDVENIRGVYFQFENAGSRDIKDAPVIYMDNVVLYMSDEKVPLTNLIELDDNEICNFEKLYQRYIVTSEAKNAKCMAETEIVGTYNGVSPSNGTKMLRILTKAGDQVQGSWPKITIPEKIMQHSDMSKITKPEYSKTYFAFDIYNNSKKPMTFFPEFYASGGKGWKAFNCVSMPKQWVTVRYCFSDINEKNLADPGYFKIAWGEYTAAFADEAEFFLDNIRIIRES